MGAVTSIRKIEISINNKIGNALNEGKFRLETPFEALEKLQISYRFLLAKQIHLKAEIDHNNGQNKIKTDTKLVWETNKKTVEFTISHTWGEKITARIHLEGEGSPTEMSVAAKVLVGQCGVDLMHDISTDSIDSAEIISVNSKLFVGCVNQNDNAMRFAMNLKAKNQKTKMFQEAIDGRFFQKRRGGISINFF